MVFYNYLDKELIIINNATNEFCHELQGINFQLLFSCERDFLENIFHNIQAILKNRDFFKEWWAYDLSQPFNLHALEIEVIIKILERTSRFFKYYEDTYSYDSYLEVIVDASLDDIQDIKNKLEILVREMAFDTLSYDYLSLIKNEIDESIITFGDNHNKNLFTFSETFIMNLVDTIIVIEENRVFLHE